MRGCAGVRRVSVQRAGHSRGRRYGAAAAVRPVLPVRGDGTTRHVRGSGARGHMGDVVAAAQTVVTASHRVAHHVQVVAVTVTGEGGGWRLEVKALREDGRPEADAIHHPVHGLQSLTFSSETSGSATERALLEHEFTSRIDGPVVAFPWPAQPFRQLDEALV